MTCLPFSKSEKTGNESRQKNPKRFFSLNALSSKRSDKSALRSTLSLFETREQRESWRPELHSSEVTSPSAQQPSTKREECDADVVSAASSPTSASPPPSEIRVFSYTELRAATRNFSRSHLLGEGGFGCVYKATLRHADPNGSYYTQEVAVKQLNLKGQQGHKEWLSEVHFLGMVKHPNLMKLVGYCAEDGARGIQRLLVYEFMPNKSLEDHLFSKGHHVLSWNKRLQIILGAARGLAYLHEEINDIQVIFRDFKTSNILLDQDFSPKLSDFGLAREGPETGASHVTTVVVGTWGYAAPEYIQTGHLTSKSDVWSFGVVLLEILCGRKSMERSRPKNEQQLLEWLKPYFKGQKKLECFVDARLEGIYSLKQAEKIAALALLCLNKSPRRRPLMSEVVESLTEIVELEKGTPELNAMCAFPCDGEDSERRQPNRSGAVFRWFGTCS